MIQDIAHESHHCPGSSLCAISQHELLLRVGAALLLTQLRGVQAVVSALSAALLRGATYGWAGLRWPACWYFVWLVGRRLLLVAKFGGRRVGVAADGTANNAAGVSWKLLIYCCTVA